MATWDPSVRVSPVRPRESTFSEPRRRLGRYSEYREGRVEGIPAEKVFDDLEQELGWPG